MKHRRILSEDGVTAYDVSRDAQGVHLNTYDVHDALMKGSLIKPDAAEAVGWAIATLAKAGPAAHEAPPRPILVEFAEMKNRLRTEIEKLEQTLERLTCTLGQVVILEHRWLSGQVQRWEDVPDRLLREIQEQGPLSSEDWQGFSGF